MNKISSFSVDHNRLKPGIYISRVDKFGNTTYDLRFNKPNGNIYMECSGMHTIEHIAATLFRNSVIADKIVYFGGMFCRTGFYLIVNNVKVEIVIEIIKEVFNKLVNWDEEIPGSKEIECGNFRDHNIDLAKYYSEKYCSNIINWTLEEIDY